MNIEEMLKYISVRPGMFIGKMDMVCLRSFIEGFMLNKRIEGMDYLDKTFLEKFTPWVARRAYFTTSIDLVNLDYVYYITSEVNDPIEGIKLFFTLSNEFFAQIHSGEIEISTKDFSFKGIVITAKVVDHIAMIDENMTKEEEDIIAEQIMEYIKINCNKRKIKVNEEQLEFILMDIEGALKHSLCKIPNEVETYVNRCFDRTENFEY
ncbi:hypothetical protein QTL86_09250 [Cellulosilyticum sp. ST5]|uniref:hypothetical protein n=1 Tax=Cellulosilyticum sp. ST5 TaxID=3055805 RepID=UPI0039774CAC